MTARLVEKKINHRHDTIFAKIFLRRNECFQQKKNIELVGDQRFLFFKYIQEI